MIFGVLVYAFAIFSTEWIESTLSTKSGAISLSLSAILALFSPPIVLMI
nr:MAG TPA: hypothetical protein [Caudoviricetes sp.]